MKIEDVNRGISKHKRRRRIGRGIGSGFGKTCGRGHKGQKSRAGFSSSPVWQGGAMPLVRRVPKRGFNNKFALQVAVLNVGDLEKHFETGDEVSPDSIKSKLLSGNYDVLKILGDGELTKKLTVSAHRFSKTAQQKIEAAGGQVQVMPGRTPVREKAAEKKKQDK